MSETKRIECTERQRLLADLEEKIKQTIQAKGKPETAQAALEWKAARKAFTQHIAPH